ncbi:unnamed protein product [Prunus armeniaca]|uniref:PdxS/SNZ N-terminal domain-containing protein n=1 Tax=Prunus armeniaca TaxID=36596 RepID=A0A6J5Y744_PRUAR|nr:unnamed protein product [Prunus armeniaca]
MIQTKGDAGTRNIIEVVRHVWSVMGDIRVLQNMDDDEVFTFAKKIAVPYDLAVTHYRNPDVLAEVSCGLGEAMVGLNLKDKKGERLAN